MPKQQPLSKAELEIAQILWNLKEATVRQVHDAVPPAREIDFWTVQTLLRRLEKKEYLSSKLDGRIRIYKAQIKPQTVIRRLTDDFVDRVFGGEAIPLMQHLIKNQKLSNEELDQLRNLLKDADDE